MKPQDAERLALILKRVTAWVLWSGAAMWILWILLVEPISSGKGIPGVAQAAGSFAKVGATYAVALAAFWLVAVLVQRRMDREKGRRRS